MLLHPPVFFMLNDLQQRALCGLLDNNINSSFCTLKNAIIKIENKIKAHEDTIEPKVHSISGCKPFAGA
jgi:hypothetical protein